TRDQMAVYIARALAGGDEYVPTGPVTASFTDVPTDYWAYDHIEYAKGQQVVAGYTATTYEPTLVVSRGQMAVFIARAMAGDDGSVPAPTGGPTFSDVPQDFWSYRHIEYVAAADVVGGYGGGLYQPEGPVTRDQMAVFICRAFGLL
ncbi:MAG: S-layer homology domain-containing protein, partial [Thermoleophilia bacterium]|nr:S-layer homology domain-containing protein [Thermoleophilia bacterium]